MLDGARLFELGWPSDALSVPVGACLLPPGLGRWPAEVSAVSPWINLHSALTFADTSKISLVKSNKVQKLARIDDVMQPHYDDMDRIAFYVDLSNKDVADKFTPEWLSRLCRWIEVQLTDAAETRAPISNTSKLLTIDTGMTDVSKQLGAAQAAESLAEAPEAKATGKAKRKSQPKKAASKKTTEEFDYGPLRAAMKPGDFESLFLPFHGAVSNKRTGLGTSTQIGCITVADHTPEGLKFRLLDKKENAKADGLEVEDDAAPEKEESKEKPPSLDQGVDDSPGGEGKTCFEFNIPIFVGAASFGDVFGTKDLGRDLGPPSPPSI